MNQVYSLLIYAISDLFMQFLLPDHYHFWSAANNIVPTLMVTNEVSNQVDLYCSCLGFCKRFSVFLLVLSFWALLGIGYSNPFWVLFNSPVVLTGTVGTVYSSVVLTGTVGTFSSSVVLTGTVGTFSSSVVLTETVGTFSPSVVLMGTVGKFSSSVVFPFCPWSGFIWAIFCFCKWSGFIWAILFFAHGLVYRLEIEMQSFDYSLFLLTPALCLHIRGGWGGSSRASHIYRRSRRRRSWAPAALKEGGSLGVEGGAGSTWSRA